MAARPGAAYERAKKKQLVRDLKDSTETVQRHSISCFICGHEEKDHDVSLEKFVDGLVKEGWGYGPSDLFNTIGVMCPECWKKPDKDRGDD